MCAWKALGGVIPPDLFQVMKISDLLQQNTARPRLPSLRPNEKSGPGAGRGRAGRAGTAGTARRLPGLLVVMRPGAFGGCRGQGMGEGEGLAATASGVSVVSRSAGQGRRTSPEALAGHQPVANKRTQHQSDASDGIFTGARKD